MLEQGEDNQWFKTYNNAPMDVKQSLKRSEAEVGRSVAMQLCLSENLKKLNFHEFFPLLKEYKGCFSVKDEMWAVITKTIEHLEQNKESISRIGLAEACLTLLTRENQLQQARALEVLMSSEVTKYEMKLPVLATYRSKQVSRDGKTDHQISMRAAIKEKELRTKYQRIVKSEYRERKPYFKETRSYKRKTNPKFRERRDGFKERSYKRDSGFKKTHERTYKKDTFKKNFKGPKKQNFKGRDRKYFKKQEAPRAIKEEPRN